MDALIQGFELPFIMILAQKHNGFYNILFQLYTTRMHSSRMPIAHWLTVSGGRGSASYDLPPIWWWWWGSASYDVGLPPMVPPIGGGGVCLPMVL